MPFKKGQSGNPAGRPVGSRNRRTIAAEKLFGEDAEAMARLAIELGEKGDRVALLVCMDRIFRRVKARPVAFELPPIAKAADAAVAMDGVRRAVAGVRLSAGRAAAPSRLVANTVRPAKPAALEQRLRALESRLSQRKNRSRPFDRFGA